jgi:hypothetical protein
LINEMHQKDYKKFNCLAMLNSLFPPDGGATSAALPRSKLAIDVMKTTRTSLWKCIMDIQSSGTQILTPHMKSGVRPGEETGWPSVAESLDRYLTAALAIINECLELTAPEPIGSASGDSDRRQSASTLGSFGSSRSDSPNGGKQKSGHKPPKKPATTLERIARELLRMRSRSDPEPRR